MRAARVRLLLTKKSGVLVGARRISSTSFRVKAGGPGQGEVPSHA